MNVLRKSLNIAACMLLVASMVLPMERHTLSGPCSWPCIYPFTYTVLDNTILYIFAPFFVPLYLLSDLTTAGWFIVYSFIGMGELLVLLLPFWDGRLSKAGARIIFAITIICIISVLSYAIIPDLRVGVDDLMLGYYSLLMSFILMLLSRVVRMAIDK